MRKIAIIGGTGDQGLGLALRFAQAGLPFIIGSRDETKAYNAINKVRESFPEAEIEGYDNYTAAEKGELILLAVPYKFMADTIKGLKGALTPDKVVVSLCVPLANAVGGKPTQIVTPWEGSAAEQAQALVPKGVVVVGALHNVCAARLADIANPVENDVVVCCNKKDVRNEIIELVESIDGVRGMNGGPLCSSRTAEAMTALIIGMNIRYKMPKGLGIRFTYI